MQCAVRQRRCSTLDHIDMEQQQQSLFDVSIIKLQHEQLRHGVEPRLLRFVLINNALRSLQLHMLHIDEEEALVNSLGGGGGGGADSQFLDNNSDVFFYNTFKNGSLSSVPLSPPAAQVKVLKPDAGPGDQSPLVECQDASAMLTCASHDVVTTTSLEEDERTHPLAACCEEMCDGEEGGVVVVVGTGGKEKRLLLQNGFGESHASPGGGGGGGLRLGKRSRGEWSSSADEHGCSEGVGPRENCRCCPQDLEACHIGGGGGGGGGGGTSEGGGPDCAKKLCKPSSLLLNTAAIQKVSHPLNGLNSLNGFMDLNDPFPSPPVFPPLSPPASSTLSVSSPLPVTPPYHPISLHYSTADDSDKDSLTPSPIDFTNVDPTLYDFDTLSPPPPPLAASLPSTSHHHEATPLSTAVGGVAATATGPSLVGVVTSGHMTASANQVTVSPSHTTVSCGHDVATSVALSPHQPQESPVKSSSSDAVPAPVVSSSTSTTTTPLHSAPLPSPLCVPVSTAAPAVHLSTDHKLQQQQQLLSSKPAPSLTPPSSDVTTHLHSSSESGKMSLVSADSMVVATPTGVSTAAHGGTCAMEAMVRPNGELAALGETGRLSHERGAGHLGGKSDGGGGLVTSPEHGMVGVETDYMDEIEHIVNLLMT